MKQNLAKMPVGVKHPQHNNFDLHELNGKVVIDSNNNAIKSAT